MNQLSMLTWMSICTKMKTNRVHTSLSPQSNCRRSSLLPFTCVAWIIWNENHAPATENHWTHNELYKPNKNSKYFWCFRIGNKNKRNKQTKQNLFGFSYSKLAIANKAKQMQETKANKWWRETTEIFLVFLCFGKETKQKQEIAN